MCSRAGQGRSAEGGAVGTWGEQLGMPFTYPSCSNWKSSPQTFGQGDCVGKNAGTIEGEKVSRSTHPRLDFVQHQQDSTFIAKGAKTDEEFLVRFMNPTFTLDRLDQDCGGLIIHSVLEVGKVVEFGELEPRSKRSEALADFFAVGCGHGSIGSTVKVSHGSHDLIDLAFLSARFLLSVQSGELDQCLVRLGAAVAEEHLAGSRFFDDSFGQSTLFGNGVQVCAVDEFFGLFTNCTNPFRVRMPKAGDCNSRGKVQVASTLGVPNSGAFTPLEGNERSRIILQQGLSICLEVHGVPING